MQVARPVKAQTAFINGPQHCRSTRHCVTSTPLTRSRLTHTDTPHTFSCPLPRRLVLYALHRRSPFQLDSRLRSCRCKLDSSTAALPLQPPLAASCCCPCTALAGFLLARNPQSPVVDPLLPAAVAADHAAAAPALHAQTLQRLRGPGVFAGWRLGLGPALLLLLAGGCV